MDTALPQKFPFILDRNLAKANLTENQVCTSCDIVVVVCVYIATSNFTACYLIFNIFIFKSFFSNSLIFQCFIFFNLFFFYIYYLVRRTLKWCLGGTTATRSRPWPTEPSWWTTTRGTTPTSVGWARPWPARRTGPTRSWGSSMSTMCSSSSGASLATRLMVRLAVPITDNLQSIYFYW